MTAPRGPSSSPTGTACTTCNGATNIEFHEVFFLFPTVFVKKQSTMADNCDFVCQLQHHTIENFGQHKLHNVLLADPVLQDALRQAVNTARTKAGRTDFDDAYVDAVPFRWGPPAVRRFVAIPRCTNSLSLYVFLCVDAFLYVLTVKLMRLIQKRHMKRPLPEEGESRWKRWQREHWDDIPYLAAFVITIVGVTVTFKVLHHFVTWIEEPHFLLSLSITAYLFAYKHLDSLLPYF